MDFLIWGTTSINQFKWETKWLHQSNLIKCCGWQTFEQLRDKTKITTLKQDLLV